MHAWNPFSKDDWNDVGNKIANTAAQAGEWIGKQAVAVGEGFAQATSWVGDQGKIAYEGAKTASNSVYNEVLAPTSKFLESAGASTISTLREGTNVVIDRFKDTQVTRAIDYYTRLGALTAAKEVASGVLTAAEVTARGTLIASRATAEGVLEGARGFLSEVAKPLSTGVLQITADAANGVLEGAKQTGVGILEGGKWVVNNTLGQFDVTKIHYDGNLRDFVTGNLGNVAAELIILQKKVNPPPFTLDVNNIFESLKSLINNALDLLKSTFIDPFKKQHEQDLEIVEANAPVIDEIAQKLARMKPPSQALNILEGLSKATTSWDAAAKAKTGTAQAKARADAAAKMVLTAEQFLALKPQEKIEQAGSLDPAMKSAMIANNLELLKKNKICPGCYFENVTLENVDLTGAVLQGALMIGVTLRKVNFSSAILSSITLVGCTIVDCTFTKAKIDDAVIAAFTPDRPTIITNSNFFQAVMTGTRVNAQFRGCNLDEINGVGLELKLSAFRATTLRRANLQWLDADTVSFDARAQLTEVDLRNAILVEVDLSQAILTQAHLEGATLVYTRLSGAQADGVSLQGTNFLFGVSLGGANLAKAATSPETNWQGANLCGALMPDGTVNSSDCKKRPALHSWDLGSTNTVNENKNRLIAEKKCTGCMLEGADLRGMDLSNVDLSKSWLVRADLRGTNLRNANLRGTRMQGAKVDAATNFDGVQLCRTLMPDGSWSNDACGQPVIPVTPPAARGQVSPAQPAAAQGAPSAAALRNIETLKATKACPKCDLRNITVSKDVGLGEELNLEGALFSGADLTGVSLSRSRLQDADFQKALLVEAHFTGSQLQGANFKEADMRSVELFKVDATGAKFFKANLTSADMHRGIFKNANFSGAIMTDVDIERADFTEANLIGAQFSPRVSNGKSTADTAIFCRTIMPDGTVNNKNCPKK
jgi:uncharacterized protein YjbI with pentapeptide repeats